MIYTIILILIFILAGIGGFYLIYQQIKLVKEEIFSIWDYLKCLVYGFIFASGVIIIITMMLIFAYTDIEFLPKPSEVGDDISGLLLAPILYLMVFLLFFPLIDFLYMAYSDKNKGLSAFQEFIAEKLIHRVKKPLRYLVAVVLWLLFSILPPIILVFGFGFPFIIIFLSWSIFLPIMIISFFGIRGYISGIVNNYLHIPVIRRSSFLTFDKSNRGVKEFAEGPGYRIMLGLMIFLYFWSFYSLFQTASLMNPNIKQGFSNMNYAWSVFLVLIFGITGYFSRFWGRKVKFKWMDILFSAWLIACVGINVMINFLLTNSDKLADTFSSLIITIPITVPGNVVIFVPAAIIEESIIVFLITYYLLEFKNDFLHKTKYASVDTASQKFDPIPLFNLIRASQEDIKKHAQEELVRMYSRIPYKKELKLDSPKFMDPLFDALTDYNKDARKIGKEILIDYLQNHPKIIAEIINDCLISKNYDKKIIVGNLVLKYLDSIITYLSQKIIHSLLQDRDFHIRRIGIQILKKTFGKFESVNPDIIYPLLNDADFEIQSNVISLLAKMNYDIDFTIISNKLTHPNKKIKSAAAASLSNLGDVEDSEYVKKNMKHFLQMLSNPDIGTRSSVMKTLGTIGNFKKFKIPITPFLEGIISKNSLLRNSARIGLSKYIIEVKTKDATKMLDTLTEKLINSQDEVKLSIYGVFKDTWEIDPLKVVHVLKNDIKSKNKKIQELVSKSFIEIGQKRPDLVFQVLLSIKEEKTYIKRGVISQTIINICEKNPQAISILVNNLSTNEIIVRVNATLALSGIQESSYNLIDVPNIVNITLKETNFEVKRELLKFLLIISEQQPESVLSEIKTLFKILNEENNNIQSSLLKILIPLSKSYPESIPLKLMKKFTKVDDSLIKESAIKIIGNIGIMNLSKTFELLRILLNDKDWTVKNAAMESLHNLSKDSKDTTIAMKIVDLIDDDEKWTRLKALEITAEIIKKNPEVLSINKMKNLIISKDPDIRGRVGNILGSYDADKFDIIFPLIIDLMVDSDSNVRNKASSALVSISVNVPMKKFLPATLIYFSDETEIILQQSIALALKRIIKYESKEIKKRVIDLLTIRAEVSQDPVISKVLQDLKD